MPTSVTTPSPRDAQRALDAIADAQRRILTALTIGRAGPYLVLWGAVWFVGFGAAWAWPGRAGIIWLAAAALGWMGTLALVRRQRRRDGERGFGVGSRYALTTVALAAYAALWAVLLLSGHANAAGVYAGTVTGFAYLVAGFWRGPLLSKLGAGVTVLFLAGLLVAPAWFGLYAACLGGGGLVAAGLAFSRVDPT